jgi:hypothetical protein
MKLTKDASPNTPESNTPDPEYTPEREGPMDIELRDTPTLSIIEKLPQTLSVSELAERSRRGGL